MPVDFYSKEQVSASERRGDVLAASVHFSTRGGPRRDRRCRFESSQCRQVLNDMQSSQARCDLMTGPRISSLLLFQMRVVVSVHLLSSKCWIQSFRHQASSRDAKLSKRIDGASVFHQVQGEEATAVGTLRARYGSLDGQAPVSLSELGIWHEGGGGGGTR